MHGTTDWRGAYPRTSLCQGGKRGQVDPGVMVLAMTAAMRAQRRHICARGIEMRRAATRSNRGHEADRAWRQSLETAMSCCDETTARVPDTEVSRRALFKGAALVASVIPAARPTQSQAQGKQIKLAYCSQLLCGVPYEVARSAGYFKNQGLDVQLVYTRGGNAAMQALDIKRSEEHTSELQSQSNIVCRLLLEK